MRTRRLHAHLAYVKRADNRASVAYAAASTFARTPRPARAEASCRPRLRGKKRLEVGLRIAFLAWLGTLAHMMRTRRLHPRLCARSRLVRIMPPSIQSSFYAPAASVQFSQNRTRWRAASSEAFALYVIVAGCGRAPKAFPKRAHKRACSRLVRIM